MSLHTPGAPGLCRTAVYTATDTQLLPETAGAQSTVSIKRNEDIRGLGSNRTFLSENNLAVKRSARTNPSRGSRTLTSTLTHALFLICRLQYPICSVLHLKHHMCNYLKKNNFIQHVSHVSIFIFISLLIESSVGVSVQGQPLGF